MKAVWCMICGHIESPPADETWAMCPCEHAAYRWRDPAAGQLEVAALHSVHSDLRVVGLNNAVLEVRSAGLTNEEWRHWHALEAEHVPSGYLFHKDKRACWALLVAVGESGDVHEMPYTEAFTATRGRGGRSYPLTPHQQIGRLLDQGQADVMLWFLRDRGFIPREAKGATDD